MSYQNPPFFIVGCGRSGTSMLRGLLNSHPDLAIPLESLFIADYLRVGGHIPLEQLKLLLISEPELKEWGIEVSPDQVVDCDSIAKTIARVHEIYAQTRGKSRWGQKTPRLVRHHELLRLHFPKARFIHMVRDPRAVVSSLVRSDVHRSTVWHGSKRWIRDVKAGLALENRFNEDVLRIRYEDLVTKPDFELQRIFLFLQVDPIISSSHLREAKDDYSHFYRNIHANLSKAITGDFADQWKKHLSDTEINQLGEMVGTLPQQLGYSIGGVAGPHLTKPSLRIVLQRSRGLLLQAWMYFRYRPRYILRLFRRKWKLGLLREFLSDLNY